MASGSSKGQTECSLFLGRGREGRGFILNPRFVVNGWMVVSAGARQHASLEIAFKHSQDI